VFLRECRFDPDHRYNSITLKADAKWNASQDKEKRFFIAIILLKPRPI